MNMLKNPSLPGLNMKVRKCNMIVWPKSITTPAFNLNKLFRIFQCTSPKEFLDILKAKQKGTKYVKRGRKPALIQEYKIFKMQ